MPTTTSTAPSELSDVEDLAVPRRADKSRLRVLHVVNRLDLGGTESGILKVMAGLGNSEFSHAVCTARGHNPTFAAERAFGDCIFDASELSSKSRFLVHSFAKIMRHFRPHIVHSRNWGAIEAVFAARWAGVPVAIHSEHGYELDILHGLPMRRRLLRRAAYACADAVFTVSSDLRAYHARQAWISPQRLRVLANGVDSERFAPSQHKREALRVSLGLSPSTLLIGTVGRLVAIKGHASLLDAIDPLVRRGIDLSLILVGDGPELDRLRAKAAASVHLAPRVHFLGASKDVSGALNGMDVFALPSISEGMSNTLLEAMSTGLPVVATRVGGNPELVADGVSGLLSEVGNTAELTAQLESLALNSELRHRLGAAARAAILADYRLDLMLDRYRNLYKELAARRGLTVLQPA
jgi:sugar transferase (PEP-CTERM/EpsH1 system associated)